MQFRLRTLLIVLAVGPPLLWAGWWCLKAARANGIGDDFLVGVGMMALSLVAVVVFIAIAATSSAADSD